MCSFVAISFSPSLLLLLHRLPRDHRCPIVVLIRATYQQCSYVRPVPSQHAVNVTVLPHDSKGSQVGLQFFPSPHTDLPPPRGRHGDPFLLVLRAPSSHMRRPSIHEADVYRPDSISLSCTTGSSDSTIVFPCSAAGALPDIRDATSFLYRDPSRSHMGTPPAGIRANDDTCDPSY